MKKTIFIILLFLLTNTLFAQLNLVPNGDFEIYSSLPTNYCQCNLAVGWNNVNGDYTCVKASPDYFNLLSLSGSGFGAITPYSGNGQMGLGTYLSSVTSYREYISCQFAMPMITGHKYIVSFYLTNGTRFLKGSNNFGIHFSNNSLFQATWEPIPVIPQIEIDSIIYFYNYWQHFSFNYTADSSYKIITIGNFRDDAHTLVNTYGTSVNKIDTAGAYYLIDKIEIYDIGLYINGDSIVCSGSSVTLKIDRDSIVQWVDSLNPATILAIDSLITVAPTTTTTYLAYGNNDTASFTVHVVNPPVLNWSNDTLCQGQTLILNATTPYATYIWQDSSANPTFNVTQAGTYWVKVSINSNCFASDTINVSYQDCKPPDIYIPNSFTPNGDGLNDIFKIKTTIEFSEFKLFIFNRWGELLFESTDINNGWDGTYKGKLVPLGVYVYLLTATIKDTGENIRRTGRITVIR